MSQDLPDKKAICEDINQEPTSTATVCKSKKSRKNRRKTNSEKSSPRQSLASASSSPNLGELENTKLDAGECPSADYVREETILSMGGRPKVVVPSPKGDKLCILHRGQG